MSAAVPTLLHVAARPMSAPGVAKKTASSPRVLGTRINGVSRAKAQRTSLRLCVFTLREMSSHSLLNVCQIVAVDVSLASVFNRQKPTRAGCTETHYSGSGHLVFCG